MARSERRTYRGPCFYCVKLFKWVPVVFISLIVAWSYYAYFNELCMKSVTSTAQQVLYLIFYHIFFIMLVWAYMQTIFTEIGRVPDTFKLPDLTPEAMIDVETGENRHELLGRLSMNLPIIEVNSNGSVRYCDKCKVIKPDRAHHCSVCGECVLKMDHHCPWVNNCVGYSNYKFFMLFLFYALTYCIYVAATSLPYFIAFWDGNFGQAGATRFHILFLFFVALMFAISLSSLFGYHCYLISENRTTLESFRAPIFKRVGADKKGFHVGRYRNFQEVFGMNPLFWGVPINTGVGDGITYPSRHTL